MSKHRCSLSMSNSPGVIGGSGDWHDRGVVLALELKYIKRNVKIHFARFEILFKVDLSEIWTHRISEMGIRVDGM